MKLFHSLIIFLLALKHDIFLDGSYIFLEGFCIDIFEFIFEHIVSPELLVVFGIFLRSCFHAGLLNILKQYLNYIKMIQETTVSKITLRIKSEIIWNLESSEYLGSALFLPWSFIFYRLHWINCKHSTCFFFKTSWILWENIWYF